jgi:glycosyltransferase involved in cell wall biosynthesis
MQNLKVVVLDMQPITPAVGGGRQRLLGLYHDLGPGIQTIYVGSYDWPGESYRDQQLTESLREICVPLSEGHHQAARETTLRMDGRVMIDMEFPAQVHLSPEYLKKAREEIRDADVVIFSHPWCFPPLANDLLSHQLVVYDAHNVESLLRVALHDDLVQAGPLLEGVAGTEASLLARSDLVYCCSSEEVDLFHRIYEVPLQKLRIAPNGTFTKRFGADLLAQRAEARRNISDRYKFDGSCAVFMGSQYGPNAEAGRFIVEKLAPAMPRVTFILIGGVAESFMSLSLPSNVICTGIVDDEQKWELLLSADVAVNPMLSGAGTNVKMFDFLVSGLPVLATPVGARGIAEKSTRNGEIVIETIDNFPVALRQILEDGISDSCRKSCFELVDKKFSWEVISRTLGEELQFYASRTAGARMPVLMFSTWGTACGIAEHTQYLVEAMRDEGGDVVVFGNGLSGHESTGVVPELRIPVVRGWQWDNKQWRNSRVDLKAFERTMRSVNPRLVILQHHTGFVGVEEYYQMALSARRYGVPVVIECHDAVQLELSQAQLLSETGAKIVVHSEREAERLRGIPSVLSFPLPVYVDDNDLGYRAKSANGSGSPTIGGFGFFREYKGIDIALETVKQLRKEFKDLQYRGWHAIYPGEEDSAFVLKCVSYISENGLENAVSINTSFAKIGDVIKGLAQCDLVMLPYADSNEGASASANIALAAGAPLVISKSNIFSTLRPLSRVVENRSASSFASEISKLLRDENERAALAERAGQWVQEHSYPSMVQLFFNQAQGQANPRFSSGAH